MSSSSSSSSSSSDDEEYLTKDNKQEGWRTKLLKRGKQTQTQTEKQTQTEPKPDASKVAFKKKSLRVSFGSQVEVWEDIFTSSQTSLLHDYLALQKTWWV